MEFNIYSIGDSIFLEQILIALAMITDTADFGAMVQIGLAIGVLSAVISGISSGGQKIEIQHVLLGWIIYATMFVPTARVNIEDTYTGEVRVVDNVPIGPAAAGGIISLVGYKLTELFETGYSPIVPGLTESEFTESLRVLNDLRNKSQQSAIWSGINADSGAGSVDLRASWINYIKDCTFRKIDLKIASAHQIYTAPFETSLEFDSNLYGTQLFTDPVSTLGTNFSCTDGWAELQAVTTFGTETDNAFRSILGYNENNLTVGQTAYTKTTSAIGALLPTSVAAATYMKLAVLEPLLSSAAEKKYQTLQDLSSSMMVNQALQRRNTQWAAEQSLFMSIVRPMLAFFEAFIYAISPIMAFIIVMGAKGIQLAGKYFALLIWIQLWMPLLSIVNLYIYSAASRSLASYATMSTHNWDSFYSLNAAADTAQHWIATGGLLAASTPAIALMLIYGSAVTATHLAGRLKSTDQIDEGYVTPEIKNNASMANYDSIHSGNTVQGSALTGAQDSYGSMNFSQSFSQNKASSQARLSQNADNFTRSVGDAVTSAKTGQQIIARTSEIGASVSSNTGQIAQDSNTFAQDLVSSGSISSEHTDAAKGAYIASIGANGKIDTAKLSKMMAPINKGGKNTSTSSGAGAGVSAGVQGQISDTATDTTSQKTTKAFSKNTGHTYSDSQIANLAKSVGANLKESDSTSENKTWGESSVSDIKSSSSRLDTSAQQYQMMDAYQSNAGNGFNSSNRTIAGLAAGNHIEGQQGNTKAQQVLSDAIGNNPNLKDKQAELAAHYKNLYIPENQAENMASLNTLTNRNSYQKGEQGDQAYLRGSQQAYRAASIALGLGEPNVDTQAHTKNEGAGLDADPNSSPSAQTLGKTVNGPPQSSNIDSSQLGNPVNIDAVPNQSPVTRAHDENMEQVRAASRQGEQAVGAPIAAKAARAIQSEQDINNGTFFSAAKNGTLNAAEKYGGAAASGGGEYMNSMSQHLAEYRNMTPEQREEFLDKLESQDKTLFDNAGGVLGSIIKGASIAGNALAGGAMEAYNAYLGGDNVSDAAQGLSLQEKGQFLMMAYADSFSKGGSSAAEFVQEHGEAIKPLIQQHAMDNYGLTSNQAAVFAENFDNNEQSRSVAISNLQKDYAIRDDEGNAMSDGQGGWHMTEANRQLVDGMVNTMANASTTGDYAGSYLQNISDYNRATSSNTPRG